MEHGILVVHTDFFKCLCSLKKNSLSHAQFSIEVHHSCRTFPEFWQHWFGKSHPECPTLKVMTLDMCLLYLSLIHI